MHTPLHSVHGWLQILTCLGTVLLVAAWTCGRRAYKPYPAMGLYLLVNALAGAMIFITLRLPYASGLPAIRTIGCLIWLISYAASGVLVFFIAKQIFRDVLAPLPGLRRLALIIFAWVAVVSVLVSIPTALLPLFTRSQSVQITILQALRGISIMESSLLAFVLLAAKSLGISCRSRIFGIPLGFGILALVDTLCFIALLRNGAHIATWVLVHLIGSTLAAALWLAWTALPEPARTALGRHGVQLQRWDEIAVAFAKQPPHVTLTQPEPRGLFLQDVEAAVDRVLSRNNVHPPKAS